MQIKLIINDMMLFLTVALCFTCLALSQAQITPEDGCLLADLNDREVARIIRNNIQSGEGVPPEVTVVERFANCRAVGRLRNRFREVTETVRVLAGTTPQIVQVDFACISVGGLLTWDDPRDSQDRVTNDGATIIELLTVNATVQTDCHACRRGLSSSEDDILLHCDRCNAECLVDPQRLCYGESNTECCNVYVNDVCMNECPPNFVAGPLTDFECVCPLMCQNSGVPFDDCSGCNCTSPLFTGPLCEDPCNPNQCVNGVCSPGAIFPEFSCACDPGFTGQLCDIPIDPCDGVNCSGNGQCIAVNFEIFMCQCDPGFTGQLCETPIDPCDGVDCSGNGQCLAVNFENFTCNCDTGFTGELCEIEINQCQPNPCLNGGTCVREMFPEFRCECSLNFAGDLCQNCTLPNCKICSLTDGVCSECFGGFLLSNEGTCIVDCSICQERETPCSVNICNYYCLLNSWAEDVSSRGLQVQQFTEPPSDLPKKQLAEEVFTDAEIAEEAWVDDVVDVPELSGLQPPNRDGVSLTDWAAASRVWIENTNEWLDHIRDAFDASFPEFPSLSTLASQLESDPQGVYDRINDIYRDIIAAYQSRIL